MESTLVFLQRKMIRICFVTTLSITIKSFILDFAKYLVKTGNFDVTLICSDDETMFSHCNDAIHYIPVTMKRGISFDGLKVIKKLTNIFKQNKFDIIQYSTPNASFYASIAAKKARCPSRLYCQWGIRYMGFEKKWARFVFKMLEKIICKKSTMIEVESHSILAFGLKEHLYKKDKAYVVAEGSACGVNLSKFDIQKKQIWRREIRKQLNIPDEAIVFGYSGRITRDKGLNELFESFKRLNNPNAYLVLIGQFDNENTIDSSLRQWALNNKNVLFVDWTNEVAKYYSALDVFCSLSYREGFGLVVIEAAAMSVPSIVTNVPGQLDTIIDNEDGILVKVKDIDSVVSAMAFYVENKKMIEIFGANARKRVENVFDQQGLFESLKQRRLEFANKS